MRDVSNRRAVCVIGIASIFVTVAGAYVASHQLTDFERALIGAWEIRDSRYGEMGTVILRADRRVLTMNAGESSFADTGQSWSGDASELCFRLPTSYQSRIKSLRAGELPKLSETYRWVLESGQDPEFHASTTAIDKSVRGSFVVRWEFDLRRVDPASVEIADAPGT